MKALSLWQPHAIAIGVKIKPFETRGWPLPAWALNVPVAIHAARTPFREKDWPWPWFKECRDRLRAAGVSVHSLDYGKVVCLVTFTECLPTGQVRQGLKPDDAFWGDFRDVGDDGRRRYAFRIADVRLIPQPQRPALAGRQLFFDVPDWVGLWG